MTAHTAVTSKGLDKEIVQAVLQDWRTAPVNEKVRATLGFLEKLTRTPNAVSQGDITAMKEAGVSEKGIEEAIYVCFVFCTINRLANSFDFELANEKSLNRVGFVLYNMGYGIGVLPG
jgi:alkylhydroperoxidase family enzyme